jgi:hypothetical protein
LVSTGLYVPTSDIDLVVMDSRCTNIQDGLKAIASALVRRQLATKIQVWLATAPVFRPSTVHCDTHLLLVVPIALAHQRCSRGSSTGLTKACAVAAGELLRLCGHVPAVKWDTCGGDTLQVIGKARVPIIKFETTGYGGIAFDVSFDVANGPQVCTLP